MSIKIVDKLATKFPEEFHFDSKELSYLLEGATGDINFDAKYDKNGLYSIISDHYNGIDCDRLDYLKRDIMNAKIDIPFNNIDVVSSFQFLGEFNGRGNHIAFAKKDIHKVNNFLALRHRMYKKMYLCKESEACEEFYNDLILEFKSELKLKKLVSSVEGYLSLTDR